MQYFSAVPGDKRSRLPGGTNEAVCPGTNALICLGLLGKDERLLSRIARRSWNRRQQDAAGRPAGQNQRCFQVSGDGFEGQIGVCMPLGMPMHRGPGVRTSGAARLGACPERLVDDGLDGARAAAAFGAAAKAAIDLLGTSGKVFC
jgi:hypothetical protein